MTVSLYRQYRPQTFAEVVGQNHIKVTLQNEIKQGKIAHAYLFSGPRGIGKTTTARLIAKAVNCEKLKAGEFEPCDKCAACQEIVQGKSLDVIEIDAASHTGVDNVRENIIESARFTPSRLKNKVFIIDEVHMLSTAAFNALLKTLEEPPANVIFILCTTEIHKIPATIISRCQRFDFRKVSFEDIVNHLGYICKKEGVSCDKEVLQSIARHSEGYLRDAVGLVGQILSLGEKKITLEQAQLVIPRSNFILVFEFVECLANKDTAKALKLINRLVDEGINLSQFVLDLIEFLRKLLLAKISGQLDEFSLELEAEEEQKVTAILNKLNLNQVVSWIDTFVLKSQAIKQSAILQLPLELAVVEICGEISKSAEMVGSGGTKAGGGEKIEAGNQKLVINRAAGDGVKGVVKLENVEAEVKNEEVKPEAKRGSSGVVKLEDVEAKWGELIASLDFNNHSMSMTLHVGRPIAVDGEVVTIGFKYKFHQEMMSEKKAKLILTQALSKVMGVDLDINLVTADNIEIKPIRSAAPAENIGGILTDVAEMFGVKII